MLALPLAGWCASPLPSDPIAIRNELRALRKRSADNDPKVRARIDALMKQLQKLQGERDAAESKARGEVRPVEEGEEAAATREKMYEQVQKSAEKGKGAELDLAEPVAEQIVKEYEDDRNPTIKNPFYYQQQTTLVIDLSRQEAPALIEVMDKFTGITMLVLTGGANGAPVDLPRILGKAKNYPLSELYIVNFRGFLGAIPESIGQFSGLTRLSLFGNNLAKLPAAMAKMKQLKILHVEVNPLSTVMPTVKGLVFLEELGIAKTSISAAEQTQLTELLPNCKVTTK
jgi:hypothetical protein